MRKKKSPRKVTTTKSKTTKPTKPEEPKVSIVTVSFDKDLRWLKYSLLSQEKYCEGYHGKVIIYDDHEDDCEASISYCKSKGIPHHVNEEAKLIKKGYVRQQFMKFYADKYVPEGTTHVCHVDSDSIFTELHDPSIYFKDGKPIMLYTPYSEFFADHQPDNVKKALHVWQDVTSLAMNEKVENEYMRRMPLVYPVEIHEEMRKFFLEVHQKSVFEYLFDACELEPPLNNFTEYNFMGAWCRKFCPEKFHWVNTQTDTFDPMPFNQYWSHANLHDKEEEIKAWILETPEYRDEHGITFTRD